MKAACSRWSTALSMHVHLMFKITSCCLCSLYLTTMGVSWQVRCTPLKVHHWASPFDDFPYQCQSTLKTIWSLIVTQLQMNLIPQGKWQALSRIIQRAQELLSKSVNFIQYQQQGTPTWCVWCLCIRFADTIRFYSPITSLFIIHNTPPAIASFPRSIYAMISSESQILLISVQNILHD